MRTHRPENVRIRWVAVWWVAEQLAALTAETAGRAVGHRPP
jgi:hypothetical protein